MHYVSSKKNHLCFRGLGQKTIKLGKSAYFVTHDSASRTRALSSARGYAKLKVIDTAYAVNLDHLSVSDGGLKVSAEPLL